jgi:hypothetical protein
VNIKKRKNMGMAGEFGNLYLPLPEILVSRFRIFGKVMKRESGVTPEQTRCCKLFSVNG